MIAVGDRFIPRVGDAVEQMNEEIEVTGVGSRVWVKRVRDGLTWDMNESTIALQWTSLAVPVAAHVVPPLPGVLPRRLGDGLRELADMLDERERLYGPAIASWERIARLAGVTTEQALGVLIAMKRERALFSPENPDHLRDEQGYLAILAEVRRTAAP